MQAPTPMSRCGPVGQTPHLRHQPKGRRHSASRVADDRARTLPERTIPLTPAAGTSPGRPGSAGHDHRPGAAVAGRFPRPGSFRQRKRPGRGGDPAIRDHLHVDRQLGHDRADRSRSRPSRCCSRTSAPSSSTRSAGCGRAEPLPKIRSAQAGSGSGRHPLLDPAVLGRAPSRRAVLGRAPSGRAPSGRAPRGAARGRAGRSRR